jgi:hypothetical protein
MTNSVLGQTNDNLLITKIAEFKWDNDIGLPYHEGYSANYSFSSFEVLDEHTIAFLCNTE